MSEIKDGGPAFPASRMEQGSSPEAEEIGGYFEVQYSGLTLRDYFAAKAMPEIYSRVESGGFERVAKLAYELADAMLLARSQS